MLQMTIRGLPNWAKISFALAWCACFVVALLLAFAPLDQLSLIAWILAPLEHHIKLERAVYSPLAYLILFTLVAWGETMIPSRRQPLWSPSLVLDACWYVTSMMAQVLFIGAWVVIVKEFYDQYLTFLTVTAVSDWHPAWKLITAILVADFAKWFSHYLRHKVHFLWVFHAVHHSQQHMNVFTVNRNHPIDLLFSRTFNALPLLMFQNAVPIILGWLIAETMYSKFYHANIRLNFGPLGWIFVTPQSHRVHHSSVPGQQDLNFGFTFSIWDRMFGTQHDDPNEYPETGIDDQSFPHEDNFSVRHLARSWLEQMVYPFKALRTPPQSVDK